MRHFTKTDLERAARVAACMGEWRDRAWIEQAVAHAVEVVAEEVPVCYSEVELRQVLQFALEREDVADILEDALHAIKR